MRLMYKICNNNTSRTFHMTNTLFNSTKTFNVNNYVMHTVGAKRFFAQPLSVAKHILKAKPYHPQTRARITRQKGIYRRRCMHSASQNCPSPNNLPSLKATTQTLNKYHTLRHTQVSLQLFKIATGYHNTLKCIYLVQSRTFYAQSEKDFTQYFLCTTLSREVA